MTLWNNLFTFINQSILKNNIMDNKSKNTSTVAGVLFVGFIMIGLALGLLFHQVAVGILLGIGVGFVAMGITWAVLKQK